MSRWCIGATVALGAVVLAAGAGAAALWHAGISARPEPARLEAALARWLRNRAIPAEARTAKNPLAPTPEVLAHARAHFADHCASCHANDGSGDTSIGRRLYPRAPDMRSRETQSLTDGQLFYIIENGVRLTGMPGWGGSGDGSDSWALVHFIRHLPQLTPAEKAEMERQNPRSPDEWRELQEDDAFLGEHHGAETEHGHRHAR